MTETCSDASLLIVDDEPLARDRLRSLLVEIGAGNIVGEAKHGQEAIELSQQEKPDIVLMDIRMPGMDGIEAAKHLSSLEYPPAVIFTTAYGDYALDAFDAQAIDYVLKPIRKERLMHAIDRAHILSQSNLDFLEETMPRMRTHLSAIVQGNIKLIPVSDVIYLKADQKYVSVVFAGGEVLIEESLKSLEIEFSAVFMRIHRNSLVNRAMIKELIKEKNGWSLALKGVSETLSVSRRLHRDVWNYIRA